MNIHNSKHDVISNNNGINPYYVLLSDHLIDVNWDGCAATVHTLSLSILIHIQ